MNTHVIYHNYLFSPLSFQLSVQQLIDFELNQTILSQAPLRPLYLYQVYVAYQLSSASSFERVHFFSIICTGMPFSHLFWGYANWIKKIINFDFPKIRTKDLLDSIGNLMTNLNARPRCPPHFALFRELKKAKWFLRTFQWILLVFFNNVSGIVNWNCWVSFSLCLFVNLFFLYDCLYLSVHLSLSLSVFLSLSVSTSFALSFSVCGCLSISIYSSLCLSMIHSLSFYGSLWPLIFLTFFLWFSLSLNLYYL